MLKKSVQQGRSERRCEEVHTALRVGRSPLEWILANGKSPPALLSSEKPLLNVEPLSDARTKLTDFFSILLAAPDSTGKPADHATGDVVDMTVAQISQRFCCNVAAMAGLAIDHQMGLQLGFNKQGSESSDPLTLMCKLGTP